MSRCAGLLALALLATGAWALPGSATAGVPRACIHPGADPLLCPIETRRVTHRVLSAARLRALARQRAALEAVAPLEDRERNRLLEGIRRCCDRR